MAKNIIINKEQERIILEHIEELNKQKAISEKLKNDLQTGNTPLSNLPISDNLNKKIIEDLLMCGYEAAITNFNDDITSVPIDKVTEKLGKLIRICQKKEEKIHTELEKLCLDVALSYFNDEELQDVVLECRLVNNINNQDFHIEPNILDYEYEDIENYDSTELDVTHRKLCNVIAMGGALRLYDELQQYFIPELFKLDEELPHLYSKILKINNYLLYVSKDEITDKNNMQSGCVNVTLDTTRGDVIIAVGTIFPFLLIETLRGFIEIMSDKALPENQREAENIIDKADTLKDEPWYMIIGTQLWDQISDKDGNYCQQILHDFFEMDKSEFIRFMCELLAKTKKGKQDLEHYKEIFKYNRDYASFEKDLEKRREENQLITDDRYLCESIDEATYPQSFNLETFKQLKSFAQRIAYCQARLPKLGAGSSRVVYQIDNNTVLKLAKNKKGLAQNQAEADLNNDYFLRDLGLLAEVYDVADNYEWIEMQFARQAKKADFQRITGFSFDIFQYFIVWCVINYGGQRIYFSIPDDIKELFKSGHFQDKKNEDGNFFGIMEEYIGNYDPEGYEDLRRLTSYGIIHSKTGDRIVLIDYGLSDDVLKQYYKR